MKDINDRFGHAAGDQALRATAQLLCATFRDSDVIARLGGDEFCVLLPDGPDLTAALHRLDEQIRARPDDAFPPMSLSLGLALYHWAEPCSIETLMAQADAAMYRDKARKRVDTPLPAGSPPGDG